MEVLGRSLFFALALAPACYSPDLRDCTVTCASTSDCAHGQLCGDDHLCAVAARAGHCLEPLPLNDAGIVDAGPDAPAPPDAAAPASDARPDDGGPGDVILHIHIDGLGKVKLRGGGTCSAGPSDHIECYLDAPANVPATLDAIPGDGFSFEHWTTMVCDHQDETCTFTPVTATDVGVRFRREDH
jgi:hypothetical protein